MNGLRTGEEHSYCQARHRVTQAAKVLLDTEMGDILEAVVKTCGS